MQALQDSRLNWRRFGTAFKLVVVPLLLVWLLLELRRLSPDIAAPVRWSHIALGLAVYQVALVLFAVRMRLVLLLFGIRISPRAAVRIHLQSMCYYFLIPMSAGIEIARYLKIKKEQPSLTLSHLAPAVLMDRVIGLLGALLVAAATGAWLGAAVLAIIDWKTVASLAAAGAAGLAGLLLLPWVRRNVRTILNHMTAPAAHVLSPIIVSVAMHAIAAFGVLLIAQGMGVDSDFLEIVFGYAASVMGMAIPISFAGVGGSEAVSMSVFLALGYGQAAAAILTLVGFAVRVLAAIQGAVLEVYETAVTAWEGQKHGSHH